MRDDHLGVVRHRRLALGAAEGPTALPAPLKLEGYIELNLFYYIMIPLHDIRAPQSVRV